MSLVAGKLSLSSLDHFATCIIPVLIFSLCCSYLTGQVACTTEVKPCGIEELQGIEPKGTFGFPCSHWCCGSSCIKFTV